MKSIRTYIFGFVLSLALTIAAFGIVELHLTSAHEFPSHSTATLVLIVVALIQLFVQLFLFLHVGVEPKPRWNLLELSFAAITVAILVGGTLWIMGNLMHMQHVAAPNVFEEENIFPTGNDHVQ
jgi:cytochrome o ubiquinol oxidase operon protein cyoD